VSPEDVEFVQIAEPSRMGLSAYRELRLDVERRAHDVASNWLRSDGTPAMRLVTEPCDRRYVAAILSAADVALVTPERDGMNLGAKEFSIYNEQRAGVLVLVDVATPGVRFRTTTRRCRVFGPTAARRVDRKPFPPRRDFDGLGDVARADGTDGVAMASKV